ncbi:Biotin synthesis protein BioH [uncultured Candidatus Thioglobus sp.]|nr:Biotin synthesis protein BioH [uncultured Candidatus Thioglobus sp.]
MVLLHGWGFNSELFNSLIAQYQQQYRITKIDLPGHGRSDEVAGGIDEWCDEIIKILHEKSIKNPILLGWSLGGLLAIKIASQIPIERLILVATTPKFVRIKDWQYGIEADNFRQFSTALSLNLSKGLKRFVSLQTDNKTQLKLLAQSIDALPTTTIALNQGLEILLTTDLVQLFKQLTIPMQVILGNRDTLVPIKIADWYKQQGVSVTILDTGHLSFLHQDFLL